MSEASPGRGGAALVLEQLSARIETGALQLPLLPGSVAEVMARVQDPSCEVSALAELVERDPALAAHVLRVANSSAYAPREPIVSLQQAASRIGFSALGEIALGVVLRGRVFRASDRSQALKALWRHSAETGLWAKEVARALRRNVEGAFLCGLLHDLGRAVLIDALSELEQAERIALAPHELDEALGRLHAEVGARLLQAWELPNWMVAAVVAHEEPQAAEAWAAEAHQTALADALAHFDPAGGEAALAELRAHASLPVLGIYADELDALLAQRARIQQRAQALS